jgi:general secretion pathway protein A
MVLDYYELQEQPFGVTPDSRYLFLSETHREALASLLYGVEAGCGFVALIAKPGLGKTTLLFHALNQLREKATTVFLFQTVCTPMDLLRVLLTGLGVNGIQGTLIEMQLKLKEVLTEQSRSGKRVVVVIDEAQNLDDSVLELVRMLSNFETSREKLIQIILSGQPQLAEKIASPELVQLRQRVSIFARLKPFSPADTELYIDHRMRTAGYGLKAPVFTRNALALITQYSEGIPRNINNLCFNALSLGCALQRNPIDSAVIREVVADLDLDRWRRKSPTPALPEEQVALEPPAFLSAASAPSMLNGWLPKLAIAVAILLVTAGSLFATHRWSGPKAAVLTSRASAPPVSPTSSSLGDDQPSDSPAPAAAMAEVHTDGIVPPTADAPSSLSGADRELQPEGSANTVQVLPRRTLLGICVENFGTCNPEILKEIHRLNPWISNLDHIETGQKIRIPVVPKLSTTSMVEQPGNASGAERGMQ